MDCKRKNLNRPENPERNIPGWCTVDLFAFNQLTIIFLVWDFFTPTLADGVSLEFEWQQVSSFQDPSPSPGRSQQWWCPLVLFLPSPPVPVPILLWLYQAHQSQLVSSHWHIPQLLQFSSKVKVLISLFSFVQFPLVVCRNGKVHYSADSLFVVDYRLVWSSGRD